MSVELGGASRRDWWRDVTDVRVRWKAVYVACFLAMAVGFPAAYVSRGLHVDESLYLVLGSHLEAGSALYVDVVDHKPPGIFYLAAAADALFSATHLPLRLLTYGVVALTGLLVLRLGTRLYGASVGMTASLLYVLGSYLPHFDGFAFLTEQYVACCTVVAASLFLRERSRAADVGVGVALGVGVLFNQAVFLFGGAILAYFAARVATAERRRVVARGAVDRTLCIGLGFALPVGAALAYFASLGALGALIEYTLVVPLVEYDPPFDAVGHLYMTLSYLPVWGLALGGVGLAFARLVRERSATRTLFVACWALFLSYPGMTQFVGDHKLLYVFPPVALLAALTLRWLWVRADRRLVALVPTGGVSRSQLATLALAVVAASALAAGGFNVVYGLAVFDESIEDQREAAAAVDEYAQGEVYTHPFRFDLVYFGEGLRSPDMYVGAVYSPDLAERVTGTLESKEVPYVVVEKDYVAEDGTITGEGYFAEYERIVGEYIAQNYERVGTTDKYVVYERVEDAEGSEAAERRTVQAQRAPGWPTVPTLAPAAAG